MNKAWTTTIVCLHFLFLQFSIAQCPSGDILLSSQAEVDFFATNFPNCSEIHANLIIGNPMPMPGSDISDLSGLSGVQETEGLIIQNNPVLTNLIGLNNLEEIHGDLFVMLNQNLNDLTDLTSLQGQLNSISIMANDKLEDLSGLEDIFLASGSLTIESNPILENLNGLGKILSVYDLRIGNNPLLNDISSLNGLTTAKQIKVNNLPSLTNLDGLNALSNVNSTFEITDLPLLSDIQGLGGLQNVGGSFTLAMLPALQVLDGLENLAGVYTLVLMNNVGLKNLLALSDLSNIQNLQISTCDNLESLKGLESVTQLQNLLLLNNPSILNLNGLQNLGEVSMHVQISLNASLEHLDDFSGLNEIKGALAIVNNDELHSILGVKDAALSGTLLIIMDNAKLSHCHIKSVCDYIDVSAANATIANNDIGCKSVPDVHTACQALVLPVEMLGFEVVKKGETAELSWETLSEFNNAGFEVQRSTDGQLWKTIGWIASKEINQARNIYQYTDTPEMKGNIYYRLLQIDNDGLSKTGEVKSLNFGYVDSNLSVFPNPAQDRVTIEYQFANGLTKEADVRLYDLTGQLCKTVRNDQDRLINLELQGLPAGYYTLVVNGISTKLIIGN